MGIAPEVGMGAVRISLGRSTTEGEIEQVVDRLRPGAHMNTTTAPV
jgi:cysteine desulfurase